MGLARTLTAGVVSGLLENPDRGLAVKGQDTSKPERIGALLEARKAGDTVTYDVLRGGKRMQVSFALPAAVAVPSLSASATKTK
jgi:PDZ domain-containing secreted protein